VFDLAPNQRKPKRRPFQGPSGGHTVQDKEFDVVNAGLWQVSYQLVELGRDERV